MSVELRNIGFDVASGPLIHDLSIRIEKGSAVLLMGPSGSGKTLLLKIMAGIIPPSHGEVLLDGRAFSRMSDQEINREHLRTGFVFQDAALWQNLSVYANLALATSHHYPKTSPAEIRERIERLCRRMDYTEDLDQRPALLSVGERKVASIIRALMLDPDYLFMDEPSGALDSRGAERLLDLLKEKKAQGKTLVIAGHDEKIASMIADSIIVIDDGRLLAFETVQNLVRTEDRRVRTILTDVFDLSSTYDTDILDILGSGDVDPFG